jgi:hypothetical protein
LQRMRVYYQLYAKLGLLERPKEFKSKSRV